MEGAGPAHETGGEDVLNIVLGILNAVGGHQDGAGECGKFFFLVLPCGSVVTGEVRVFFQFWVAVAGQHFTVGVNVYAFPFGLPEQGFQILEIVTGDEDGLACGCAELDFGRFGVTVSGGVGGVEEFHGSDIDATTFQTGFDTLFESQICGQGGGEQFLNLGVRFVVLVAEDGGVVEVGSDALEAVCQSLLERLEVFVGFGVVFNAVLSALSHEACEVGSRFENRGTVEVHAGYFGLEGFALCNTFVDKGDKAGVIEVDVGQGGENGLDGEEIHFGVFNACIAGGDGDLGEAFGQMKKKVLKLGGVVGFPADTDLGTTALGGLFTLITKHGFTPYVLVIFIS